jgi:hypothetical protein
MPAPTLRLNIGLLPHMVRPHISCVDSGDAPWRFKHMLACRRHAGISNTYWHFTHSGDGPMVFESHAGISNSCWDFKHALGFQTPGGDRGDGGREGQGAGQGRSGRGGEGKGGEGRGGEDRRLPRTGRPAESCRQQRQQGGSPRQSRPWLSCSGAFDPAVAVGVIASSRRGSRTVDVETQTHGWLLKQMLDVETRMVGCSNAHAYVETTCGCVSKLRYEPVALGGGL